MNKDGMESKEDIENRIRCLADKSIKKLTDIEANSGIQKPHKPMESVI